MVCKVVYEVYIHKSLNPEVQKLSDFFIKIILQNCKTKLKSYKMFLYYRRNNILNKVNYGTT